MTCAAIGLVLAVLSSGAGAEDSAGIIRHGRFEFHAAQADQPLVRSLEPLADRALTDITADLGRIPAGPITVVLAPDDKAFNRFQPADHPLPDWAVGVAYPGAMTMVIRSYHIPGTPRQDIGTIFVHELTHLVLGARFGEHPVPFWLHEGLAMHEAGEWDPGHEWDLVRAVLADRVPPLDALTAMGMRRSDARTAYALSDALVGHMIATYGRESFGAFVDRLADGQSFEDALLRGLRVTPERFDETWRAHLGRRYTWIPLITSSSALWAIMMVVAFVAYAAKKRRNRKIAAAWAEEEQQRQPESP